MQLQILTKSGVGEGLGMRLDILFSDPGIHCISVLTVSHKQVGQFEHSHLHGLSFTKVNHACMVIEEFFFELFLPYLNP